MGEKQLLSGNEAIALAAFDAGVALGAGYPGTPSSEILEEFSNLGGTAQWSPNEKAAIEVAIGGAFGQVRTLVTMKHVGLNVAADPLFTIAYSGTPGGLVVITADDPGMASSQNEQDNRRYAAAAGCRCWNRPIRRRLTICFSKRTNFRKPTARRCFTGSPRASATPSAS